MSAIAGGRLAAVLTPFNPLEGLLVVARPLPKRLRRELDRRTEATREAAAQSWDHQAISRHAARFEPRTFKARFEALVDRLRRGRESAGRVLVVEGGDGL